MLYWKGLAHITVMADAHEAFSSQYALLPSMVAMGDVRALGLVAQVGNTINRWEEHGREVEGEIKVESEPHRRHASTLGCTPLASRRVLDVDTDIILGGDGVPYES
jgi:hypothetical protein